MLEPKCTQGSGPMRARRRGSGRAPGDARGPAVVGRWGRAGAAAGRVGAGGRRVRPARRQPVRAARLQRRELPRVVPGAGRAEPEPLRPRPRPRLPGDRARGQRPPRRTCSIPTAAWSCSRRPARCRTRGASGSRPGRGSTASSAPGSPTAPGATRPGRRPERSRSGPPSRGSNVRARPAGSRSSRGSPTAREADVTPFCDLRVRDDRGRRRLEHGGRPRPPARRHRGRRLLQRPGRGGRRPRPDRPGRVGPRGPRRPTSSTARSTPSSGPWASSPRARRPTPSSSAGSRST